MSESGHTAEARKKDGKRQEQAIYVPPSRKPKPPPSGPPKEPSQPPGGNRVDLAQPNAALGPSDGLSKAKNKKKKSKKKSGGNRDSVEPDDGISQLPGPQRRDANKGDVDASGSLVFRRGGKTGSYRRTSSDLLSGDRPPSPTESLHSVASSVTSRGGRRSRRKGASRRGGLAQPEQNASFADFRGHSGSMRQPPRREERGGYGYGSQRGRSGPPEPWNPRRPPQPPLNADYDRRAAPATLPRSFRPPSGGSQDVRMSNNMGPPQQPPPQRQPQSQPQSQNHQLHDDLDEGHAEPRVTRTRQSSFMSNLEMDANEMSLDDILNSDFLSTMKIDWSTEVEEECRRKAEGETMPPTPSSAPPRSGRGILQLPSTSRMNEPQPSPRASGDARNRLDARDARQQRPPPSPRAAPPPQAQPERQRPKPLLTAPMHPPQPPPQHPPQSIHPRSAQGPRPSSFEIPPRMQRQARRPVPTPPPLMKQAVAPPRSRDDLYDHLNHVVLPDLKAAGDALEAILGEAKGTRNFNVNRINPMRQTLLTQYRETLLKDIHFTFEHNLEAMMWNAGFYKTYETLRELREHAQGQELQNYEGLLYNLIDQGTEFYESLVTEYELQFRFKVSELVHELVSSDALSRLPKAQPADAEFPPLPPTAKPGTKGYAASPPANMRLGREVELGSLGHIRIVRRILPRHDAHNTRVPTPPPLQLLPSPLTPASPHREGEDGERRSGPDMTWHYTAELRGALRAKPTTYHSPNSAARAAQLSCQRFLTYLGDLARYRKQVERQADFGRARTWYLRAVQLSPNNGRPYNQLGIIAHYNHRRLEAVYFYLRALSVRHSFGSAKETLNQGTFEEIRSRVSALELEMAKQVAGERQAKESPAFRQRAESAERRRHEVWFGGAGGTSEEMETEALSDAERRMEILTKEGTQRLYQKMQLYFLDVIRMLVSKIGLEKLESVGEGALGMLRELVVGRESSPLSALSLVQLVSMGMFAVRDAARSASEGGVGTCTLQFNQAVQFTLSVWAVLMEVLSRHLSSPDQLVGAPLSEPVLRVLPALRLLSLWLTIPSVYSLYSGLSSLDGLETQLFSCAVWDQLAGLCNLVGALERLDPDFENWDTSKEDQERRLPVILPEDLCIASFFTDFDTRPSHYYVRPGVNLDEAATRIRLKSILNAGDFLADRENAKVALDSNSRFVAVRSSAVAASLQPAAVRKAPSSEDRSSSASGGLVEGSVQHQLHLHRLQEEQKEQRLAAESGPSGGLRIEVRPAWLVPDTNAFIDHLPLLQRILGPFGLAIPTIVMAELRGLASQGDEEWVGAQATAALAFLHQLAASDDPRRRKLELVTSAGSRLQSLQFTHEEIRADSKEKNDDRILKCALAYTDDGAGERRDLRRDGLLLERRVVLLTEDRALKIKALLQHVPVKTPPAFRLWAGL